MATTTARIRTGSVPFREAMARAMARRILPTSLGSADLRALSAAVRGRSVFIARGNREEFLDEIREVTRAMFAGEMTKADARLALKEKLEALGYTPAGGFPGMPAVPPAVEGSLQDIGSDRRLNLILETQFSLIANASYRARTTRRARVGQFPWYELIRVAPRRVPRGEISGSLAWPRRFVMAGGKLTMDPARNTARMIAGKFSPVWAELGSSALFDDALDVATPPFAFRSGFGWREVAREEGDALGLDPEAPEARAPEEEDAPLQDATAEALPAPQSPKLSPNTLGKLERLLKAQRAGARARYDAAVEKDLAAAAAAGNRP